MRKLKKYLMLGTFLLLLTPTSQAETDENGAEAVPLAAGSEARRLEIMFLGSRKTSHQPKVRFHTLRKAHGIKGINYTYYNDPSALTPEILSRFDGLLLYGNHDKINPGQEKALLDYSKNGGACVFLHSACGCFRNSEQFIKLLGAQFKSHGTGVFKVHKVNHEHQIMKGYPDVFETWDETYVHQKHNEDRVMLQKREEEPWTWVRTNGKGRVFYTASGHDHRCWDRDEYHDLVYRGVMWTVGKTKADLVEKLELPKLSYMKSPVNIIQGKNWPDDPTPRKNDGEPIPLTHFQKPLSPEDSMKLAQVPPGMRLELFAAEPMVTNPIAMAWDRRGRLWVTEAFDYPNSFVLNSPGQDKVVILEDTNGDGKADKRTEFATGLTIATSVLPLEDGCITTDGVDMVFLRDKDGDGKSDERTVLWSGIKLWDTHACVSNLKLGMDGWIYATVGYSGIDTTINGVQHKMGMGVLRFTRDGSAFEALQSTTNNTWGLGFTEEGRIMGSTANRNPSFYVGVTIPVAKHAGYKTGKTPRADRETIIYPITFDHLQVDHKDNFTAAAGHSIYTAGLLGESYRNKRALICAPTGKLVSAMTLHRKGASFETTNSEDNIYASADAWSAPVAAEVGPEGAVYIADWYNPVIQHNVYGPDTKKGKGNAYESPVRDRKHGRIYRISPVDSKFAKQPCLDTLDSQLAALDHDNMGWRQHAQERIVAAADPKAIPALQKLAQGSSLSRVHAIHALGRLGEDTTPYLSETTVVPGANAAALQYAKKSAQTATRLLGQIGKVSGADQFAILEYVALSPSSPEIKTALGQIFGSINKTADEDPLLREGLNLARAAHGLSSVITSRLPRIPLGESAKRGQALYKHCIECHQPDGLGTPQVFPPLDGSDWQMRNPDHAIMATLKGLMGEVTVNGQKFNGAMPAQIDFLGKDLQKLTDVINYTRMGFEHQLGEITLEDVKRINEKYKDRGFFTEADILKEVPEPIAQFNTDLTGNKGNSKQAAKEQFVDLPNGIIHQAHSSGIKGYFSIQTTFKPSSLDQWAQVWAFGATKEGEGKSGTGTDYIALIPKANSGNLRLTAKHKGKEVWIDWKPLQRNKEYQVTARYTPVGFKLFVNGELIDQKELPNKMDLGTFRNDNNWIGRSLFADPLYNGKVTELKLLPF